MNVSEDEYIGIILNEKYQLMELLGKGGMGAVYRGRHIVIGKTVAVKFLHAEFAGNKEVVKRFYREAQTAAAIGHDNIIDVMDVGISHRDEPYLVMEFLEGENLGSMLSRTGPLSIEATCGVMEPVLLALNAAHEKGIVHRDLKPENIFLVHRAGEAPKIKLIDFGISKFNESLQGEKLTRTGSVMGTPSYMSPEQARGDSNLDQRADLFSLGVILYEMLTGKLPFDGDNFTSIIVNILTTDPIPPNEAYSNFPRIAESVLEKALTKDSASRYQTALEFLEALKGLGDYSKRGEKLTELAAGITKKTFAAGSLGSENLNSDSSVASDILSQVINAATPTGWVGITTKHTTRRRSLVLPVVFLVAVVIVGGLTAFFVFGREDRKEAQVVPVSPFPEPEKLERSVEISIVGAPDGATIFYDNAKVEKNPFRVKKGDALVPVRVEAAGFEVANINVAPTMNRTIQVAMRKMAITGDEGKSGKKRRASSSSSKRRGKKTSSQKKPVSASISVPKPQPQAVVVPAPPPPTPPTPPPPQAPPPPKPVVKPAPKVKKLRKGARGTKMQTEFE